MRFGSGRFTLFMLLAAACLLAWSCSPSLPPGTIELTVASDPSLDLDTWRGTLVIMIRDSKSGDLASASQVAGHVLDSTDPYEYSYGGASEGEYTVIAFLDMAPLDGVMNAGDIVPTGAFPSADVTSEQTTPVSITLDHVQP